MTERFTGSFTQQEPIPEAGIEAALEVLRSGRLHRYNLSPDEIGEVGLLEEEFAASVGAKYALAVASGGYAMGCALRALGIGPGDKVLTNAFTLAPVPGAIASVNAEPVLVEITPELVLDLNDLEAKAKSSGARVLMLSHMRGHLVDMEALVAVCDRLGVTIIEDCAHTMGAAWNGKASGTFGAVGCFSMQTYKHINSGEGGLIVTDDPELAARMILLSGSYMLYERHGARPPMEAFEDARFVMPNVSGRMDHLRAAILRPQLADLPRQVARWAERYQTLEAGLAQTPGLHVAPRPGAETYVGSSFQFTLPGASANHIRDFVARCAARGVELKWFGADAPVGFTSRHSHWGYVSPQQLPNTDRILSGLLDMRVPLTFSVEDCALIVRIIDAEARVPASVAAE